MYWKRFLLEKVFKSFEPVSIDYGIMEKAQKIAVVPADIGWSDVGSWRALDDIAEKDPSGNIITGNIVDIKSKDSIFYAGKRLVATVGLKNTVVVDTPDATLVCNKDNTQDVKKVVDELKKKGADELVEHVTVHRPWGSYTVLEIGSRYKIKRIAVNPGAKLSHQLHHHRSEHWVVVLGTARVTVGEKTYNVHPNESTYVPISTRHRLENPGKVPLHIIEVQIGDYIEEDDIQRFDDVIISKKTIFKDLTMRTAGINRNGHPSTSSGSKKTGKGTSKGKGKNEPRRRKVRQDVYLFDLLW
jgi:mannose-1-phosphate guanylyltransferase/mannose-6-phosphate isomerase